MKIFKGQKSKPQNKIRNFYILRYIGIALLILCFPFLPTKATAFPPIFQSKYWLLADVLLLWSIGAMFEKSLFRAIIQDTAEKKEGKDALNASSLLFFATPLLFLFTCAAVVHIFALWYASPEHPMPTIDSRLQCAALVIGLFFCIYGRFIPVFKYQSMWGIRTKATLVSAESWKAIHKKCSKRMMIGGFILLLPSLLLTGISALLIASAGAVVLLGLCYFSM